MNDVQYTSGVEAESIENSESLRFYTAYAKDIVITLDKCGIPYHAIFNDSEIVLSYDGSFKEQVEEIIRKALTGANSGLLRELKEKGLPDSYLSLLPEVAEILHTTVGTLQARPEEVKLCLCKTYTDLWLCDTYTIQRNLDRVLTVNFRTKEEMQEHEKIKEQEKAPVKTAGQSEVQHDNNAYVGFTRDKHQILAEIVRRRRQQENEKIRENNERERNYRP